MTNNIEVMIPSDPKYVMIGDKKIEFKPIKVRMINGVLKAIAPFESQFRSKESKVNVIQIATQYPDSVVDLVSVGLDLEKSFVGDLDLEQLSELFFGLVEVNLDFFIQRVLPSVSKGMAHLQKELPKSLTAPSGKTASSI